jgi:hypothetical protein
MLNQLVGNETSLLQRSLHTWQKPRLIPVVVEVIALAASLSPSGVLSLRILLLVIILVMLLLVIFSSGYSITTMENGKVGDRGTRILHGQSS